MKRLPIDFDLSINQTILVDASLHHYLKNVIRISEAESLVLFNGDGFDYHANVISLGKKSTTISVTHCVENNCESPVFIRLLHGVSKGDRMDFVMQKATELGVNEIIPVITEYCAVKQTETYQEKKQQHWQQIVNFACAQSERAFIPRVSRPVKLIDAIKALDENEERLVMTPLGVSLNVFKESVEKPYQFTLLVGPEGGLSANDLAIAREFEFHEIKLGGRILRTETAALASLACLQSLFGDL